MRARPPSTLSLSWQGIKHTILRFQSEGLTTMLSASSNVTKPIKPILKTLRPIEAFERKKFIQSHDYQFNKLHEYIKNTCIYDCNCKPLKNIKLCGK